MVVLPEAQLRMIEIAELTSPLRETAVLFFVLRRVDEVRRTRTDACPVRRGAAACRGGGYETGLLDTLY